MPRLTTLALLPFLALGCSSLASEQLTPESIATAPGFGGRARVEAKGLGPIDDQPLSEAVRTTLEISGLFNRADGGADADWVVGAQVVKVEQPKWGLDMVFEVTLRWTLSAGDGRSLWSERIMTKFRSTPEEEKDVAARSEHALTGAVRANLSQAVERMRSLELPASER
jgi:hypothetical protein